MGASGRESSRPRRRRWVFMSAVAVVAVASTVRFVIAVSSMDQSARFGGWTALDVVALTIVASVVLIAGPIAIVNAWMSAGVAAVRRGSPHAMVWLVAIQENQLEAFAKLTGVELPRQQMLVGAFTPGGVSFWRGRTQSFVARVRSDRIRYRMGTETTFAGDFACVEIIAGADGRLKVFPMVERSIFPRRVPTRELESFVARMEAQAA